MTLKEVESKQKLTARKSSYLCLAFKRMKGKIKGNDITQNLSASIRGTV